ncbi:helix-turn-helix domain-containing protein [Aneurinibacillus uraniidurans]|uniref:helix-turn-helix domain-containing protein n=1 Tax=Aneurinibacillus uraniidurans TaxID=2966586 RepID=UPI00234A1DA7|nr:helix-turn-helix transcriptional regulator [Aneurinibacillus sp. B1]WCN36218.1 helix-turn-helix transcriptional regulator [Aneurinibacillus sp. B1]
MKCGDRIVELRELHEIKQKDLASHLGITSTSLSHYERNNRQPSIEILIALAEYFDVTVDYLIGRIDNKIEFTNKKLLKNYKISIDNKEVTSDELIHFIAFIRAERSLRE